MKNEFTPSPWRLTHEVTQGQFVTAEKIRSGDGSVIAVMHCNAKANAALVCAAPDMLATLERVAEWMKRDSNPEIQGIACNVFQVIDKAKGNP